MASKAGFKDEASTVSENVKVTLPSFISKLNCKSTGGVVSGINMFTWVAFPFKTGTSMFPLVSMMAKDMRVMNVVSLETANCVFLFSSFKSIEPMSMVIEGQSELLEKVWVGPTPEERVSRSSARDMTSVCSIIPETFR